MSDEQENVDAGSETSGETADTAQADTADTTTADTAEPTASERTDAAEAGETVAGGAADEAKTGDVPVDGSRTGFVENGQPCGECFCPDGRKGTIHRFDAGLVCIPNEDQSA